jgi:tRNA-Thr(GGU) m(6)t(6)A37 methyltransferase TsaA
MLRPIGVARTGLESKLAAPRQPGAAPSVPGRIELFPGHHYEDALRDLAGWDYVWVIFWFHLNSGWRPKVQPPRSTTGRKGVFATRSPHRPNPLGLSALRLVAVEGLVLHVERADLVDGTPVLDIKPYVPYTDAFPAARSGWLEAEARAAGEAGLGAQAAPADPLGPWAVDFEPLAAEQARWIETRTGMPFRDRITAVLALGPEPHAYRRIRREGEGYRLAFKEWRVQFIAAGREIRVQVIRSGYRPSQLASTRELPDDTLAIHREFRRLFGA